MHIKILVPDSAPRHALSVPPSSTHKHTYTGWFPCPRGGVRTNQHAGNGRAMKTSGVATLPNALPGVAAPIPREGLLMGFFTLVCMRVSLVRCATGFARVLHPNCTATEHERYTLHATFSHLRLQHYVEPLGHPDSTLDSTDWYLPAALAHVHVRRSSFNIHRKDRCWMQRASLENLGNGRRGRLRFYGRKGDLRYFLGDEISKEMKSSCFWLRSFYITSIALSENCVLRRYWFEEAKGLRRGAINELRRINCTWSL